MQLQSKIFCFTPMLLALSFSIAIAQEDDTSLNRYKVVEDGDGLPTLSEFQTIEDDVRLLHSEQACEQLILKASDAADSANKLANIIRQGLEPFYDASRDDRERIPRLLGQDFQPLVDAENAANKLLLVRNEFWIYEAQCLLSLGRREQGVNRLYRALDYVDPIKQTRLWKSARESLWQAVGYN